MIHDFSPHLLRNDPVLVLIAIVGAIVRLLLSVAQVVDELVHRREADDHVGLIVWRFWFRGTAHKVDRLGDVLVMAQHELFALVAFVETADDVDQNIDVSDGNLQPLLVRCWRRILEHFSGCGDAVVLPEDGRYLSSLKMANSKSTASRSMRTCGLSSSTQRKRNSGMDRICSAASLESQPHGISTSIWSVIDISVLMCWAAQVVACGAFAWHGMVLS